MGCVNLNDDGLSELTAPFPTASEPRLRILIPLIVGCAFFMEGLELDDDRGGDPGDGEEPRRDPAAAQPRDHGLSAEPGGVHPGQRLDRRPVRGARACSARRC